MAEDFEKADDLDGRAVSAKKSNAAADSFIKDFHPYLHGLASRYTPQNDEHQRDEVFAVAMVAFYEAIQNYDIARGHFFPYADRVVRSRIIDQIRRFYRQRGRTVSLETDDEEQIAAQSDVIKEMSVIRFNQETRQEALRDEIAQFQTELSAWRITFDHLAQQSPKRKKQQDELREAILKISKNTDIVQTIQIKHYFPIQAIAKITGLPPKKLERARIFILASLIILLGDYEVLSEYVGGDRLKS
ncbi:MAG: hypothetical protein FWH40_03115 [Coriobacteriia bacterium]|nr:hypothetical protein [Coriobacteriia bacterium]